MPFPGLLPPGNTAVSPPFTNLILWWDMSQQTGYNDNDLMTGCTDFSGNGNHCTGLGGAQRPTYKTTTVTINGLPVVQFVGANNSEFLSTNPPASGGLDIETWTAGTIACVARKTNDPATGINDAGLWSTAQSADFDVVGAWPWTDGTVLDPTFSTVRKSVGNLSASWTSDFYYVVTSTANEWKARMNGSEVFSTSTNTFIGNTSEGSSAILFGISDGNFGPTYFDGVMGTLLIYDAVLSGSALAQLENYLSTRWGI